ncbi:MAG: PKD domain-containing protein [Methanomicrobiales archaeon]|nr:PKD domain-containing protein [Methanomicrobiales archaeon]
MAAFTATPTTGQIPLSVTFTDQSTNTPTSWSWNFGDGDTSTVQNPSHSYSAIGTYTVTLTSTNAGGSDSEVKTSYITVTPPPAGAAFTNATPTSGVAPLSVTFTDQSTNTPTSWSWNFGDGGTSTSQNPAHSYATPGTYSVSLTVTNAGGGDTITLADYVTVRPPAPVAAFSMTPTSGAIPLSVAFTDASTGFPASWSWAFGDGGTSTSQNPTHSYTTPGIYTVTLTVTNAGGSDSETKADAVSVTVPVPVAAFAGTPLTGEVPLTVSFTDQSTNTPTSWLWEFGDGNTATFQNTAHTYIAQGTYTVKLTATNAGGSDSETKIGYITVGNPSESLVFITSTDTDRKTARRGDMVNVSIRLIAGEASPVDGMILLDRSGDSMHTCMKYDGGCQYYRWDLAKEGALLLTGNVSSNSYMGVSWFATRGEIAHTLDNSQVQVRDEIEALNYVNYSYNPDGIEPYTGEGTGGQTGMSNLRDGLYQTLDYMDGVPQKSLSSRAVIIFTDGLYNWYGNPIANGRGYARTTHLARVECASGYPGSGCMETISGMWDYDPAHPDFPDDVASFRQEIDSMSWHEAASCSAGSCVLPTSVYTFYNDIKQNHANGGWLNFTGYYWNDDGSDWGTESSHISYTTYMSAGTPYYGEWPITGSGWTGCLPGYIPCDVGTRNPAQYQVDVCDPDYPYIEYVNGLKTERGDCEQTKQNLTIFARDSNIRLYTVVLRTDADTGTTMPGSYASADDMMKILSYTTGGKYYPVHDRQDLYDAVDDIVRDLSSAATKDLTMEIDDTSVDLNSLTTVNTNNEVFEHHHINGVSTTTQSWDMNGALIDDLATVPEAQDWLTTHQLTYFVDDLNVGDTFQMNYTVQVNARGRINAIGEDSKVTFKDGYELPLPPTYIDVENNAPVFDDIEDQTIDRTAALTFTVTATDADGDPLTYASGALPSGSSFDPATRIFTWTGDKRRGSYSATFTVTDGMATDTETVFITVTDLSPKIIVR